MLRSISSPCSRTTGLPDPSSEYAYCQPFDSPCGMEASSEADDGEGADLLPRRLAGERELHALPDTELANAGTAERLPVEPQLVLAVVDDQSAAGLRVVRPDGALRHVAGTSIRGILK